VLVCFGRFCGAAEISSVDVGGKPVFEAECAAANEQVKLTVCMLSETTGVPVHRGWGCNIEVTDENYTKKESGATCLSCARRRPGEDRMHAVYGDSAQLAAVSGFSLQV
jgi:hypothetical protein